MLALVLSTATAFSSNDFHSHPEVTLEVIGTHAGEPRVFDEGAAEIVAYDPHTERLFVVNADAGTVDVLDLSDPANPTEHGQIDVSAFGSPNSVDVKNKLVAIAVEADPNQNPGSVVFYHSETLAFLNAVPVGALPDMVTFTPDGKKVLVCNEGEPEGYLAGQNDPEGSISIIYLYFGVENAWVRTADFSRFNDDKDELIARGVRIFGPNASVAQDFEPESVTPVGNWLAWASLQENNAFAVIDLLRARVLKIQPLGFKDHSRWRNALDASDDDDAINIQPWPVLGMYMPDIIVGYEDKSGQHFIVSANEGDAREYDGLEEEARVGDDEIVLDPNAFADPMTLKMDENLGRLNITSTLGQNDAGEYEKLYSFGARSFSIWRLDGRLVYDSGKDFEKITAELLPDHFNSDNTEQDSFDSRSDSKGPEPEGLTVGKIEGRQYAFIGLERIGGIMVYDITDPREPRFATYVNNRDFAPQFDEDNTDGFEIAGDLGPEGLEFIPAWDSPNGEALLVTGSEVSGTVTIWQIDVD